LPVIVEPNVLLAASTVRSTSAEVVLTFELTSLEAATSALWAFCAVVWILSVVFAVTAASDFSMSAETALIWIAACLHRRQDRGARFHPLADRYAPGTARSFYFVKLLDQ